MTSNQRTALLGLGASLGFLAALVGFAALDPAYSHAAKAVSELGAVGAPNALAWNLIGFLGVGLLLTLFGVGVGRAAGSPVAGGLLALFGLAFAAAAIPADMSDLSSPGSVAHIVASQAVLLFWALGLGRLLLLKGAPAGFRPAAAIGLLLAVGSIVLRGAEVLPPGWSQRVSFAIVLGWVAAASLLLLRREREAKAG